jgi:hypothetical protein
MAIHNIIKNNTGRSFKTAENPMLGIGINWTSDNTSIECLVTKIWPR